MQIAKMRSKIFSTDQIRAIQDGRMTQFMQVVKPQPGLHAEFCRYDVIGQALFTDNTRIGCPFGKIGDTLYCREDWAVNERGEYEYRADGKEAPVLLCLTFEGLKTINRWYPSATMPREAARLFLRITNIRVMRVQELKEQDAAAQGYVDHKKFKWCIDELARCNEKIWIENTWIWTIDFTKTDKP